jgi:hypothetical protein
MAKSKKEQAKAVKALIEGQEKLIIKKIYKTKKVSKKQYNKDLNSYLCRISNQSSILLAYIGEPVRVVYQAPSSQLKLVGKTGKIVNIISDTLGNRIYEIAFREKGISSVHRVSKLNLTFSEDEIEFVNPEKFEQLCSEVQNVTC